jgi:hypothetical protein
MKQAPNDIYQRVKQLGQNVKDRLKSQGIIVPSKTEDGTIRVGYFKIKKSQTGFYRVLDYSNDIVIDHINLPQTAALLANRLALGKCIDDVLLSADRSYGHALFEEELHKQIAEKNIQSNNLDRADIMFTKFKIDKHKKEEHKKVILNGFEKLMRFR